jgi:Zn finger protein HypA/HybF involved in hydrogenase expression
MDEITISTLDFIKLRKEGLVPAYVYRCDKCHRTKVLPKAFNPMCPKCKQQMHIDDGSWAW